MDGPTAWERYGAMEASVKAVRDLHREENGKCMGCPKSLTREGVVVYGDYPCPTIQVMESYRV